MITKERMDVHSDQMDIITSPTRSGSVVLLSSKDEHEPDPSLDGQPEDTAAEQSSSAPGSQDQSATKLLRILLADDHRILRQGLRRLLELEDDMEVVGEAADGHEAVNMARLMQPDIIIMDISMPGMNGIDATRTIMADMPDVRIVGLSMHETSAVVASMLEAGAKAYLAKGCPVEDLTAAIRGTDSPQ